MADLMAAPDPDLEPLSPDSAFHYDFWLIYHETRRNDPVIRSTVEFVTRCFEGAVEGSINSRAAE
jgi:DNA-binding transcriptional LysR family regulator